MPEYLSPGVYVEEIETGPQPIEGVSTSTAGFVGMAERGPVNVPILLTSPGDYRNWFGGLLNRDEFQDPIDPTRSHCYLPYAVQGFFTNGGRRAYVMRVLPDEATAAHRDMFNRANANDADTVLLRAAREGSGAAAGDANTLVVLDDSLLSNNDIVRIGSGSASEFLQVANISAGATDLTTLDTPLTLNHASGTAVSKLSAPAAALPNYSLNTATVGGESSISVKCTTSDLVANPPAVVALGGEIFKVTGPGVGAANIFSLPITPNVAGVHLLNDPVVPEMIALTQAANPNDTAIEVYSQQNLAGTAGVQIGTGAGAELVPVTTATPHGGGAFTLALGKTLAGAHAINAIVTDVAAAGTVLESDASAGDSLLFLTAGAAVGNVVTIGAGTNAEVRTVGHLGRFALTKPLAGDAAANSTIAEIQGAPSGTATTLTAATGSGRNISLASRNGIAAGTMLMLGAVPNEEYAVVAALTGDTALGLDPGSVVLQSALSGSYALGAAVTAFTLAVPPVSPNQTTRTLFAAAAGGRDLVLAWGGGWNTGDLFSLTTPDGAVSFHRLASAPVLAGVPGFTPSHVQLTSPVQRTHAMGDVVAERQSLFRVEALDRGAWGRRLHVSVTDEQPGLVPRAAVTGVAPPLQLKLSTLTGIEPGTYLELTNSAGVIVDTANPLKVRSIDRANATIRLDAALSAAQLGAIGTATPANPVLVRSREFSLMVMLYRRPDPAVPSRNETVVQSEVFRQLSLDPRHSRYIEKVIGATDGPPALEDRRPKGGSMLVRVKDSELVAANRELPRLGPEVMFDLMPGGLLRAARFALDTGVDGDDAMGAVLDTMYVGLDDNEPANRTGIPALRNVPQISIVAVPGQGAATIQAALIAHCEAAQYRFAVLDPEASDDALADIQAQRQQFDTKYAAIYYPWLSIPDPMPDNLASIASFPLPPSGHVVGIYARTDEQRGVHKAPANEVVLGITNVTRKLYKGEQDILNPEPLNINVIRDFRADGRSIRVWGARCITSDTDYKYVPVRRLIMFIEQSIDLGLQWAVFEPNAPALWARVTRSVVNFLNTVWRSGALEGTKPEEAFFVQCGTDTMTQDDIDNGRLIMVIGIAPAKPAEYVIIRIGLTAATNLS